MMAAATLMISEAMTAQFCIIDNSSSNNINIIWSLLLVIGFLGIANISGVGLFLYGWGWQHGHFVPSPLPLWFHKSPMRSFSPFRQLLPNWILNVFPMPVFLFLQVPVHLHLPLIWSDRTNKFQRSSIRSNQRTEIVPWWESHPDRKLTALLKHREGELDIERVVGGELLES